MRIAIIGTGRVGTAIGGGLAVAGHEVVFGSRHPSSVTALPGVVTSPASSIEGAEAVVAAIPGRDTPASLSALGAPALAGKILIDVGNALTESFELMYPNASLGAALQAEFPETRVVKTLNTVQSALMAHPGDVPASTVFLSGDDNAAKQVVGELLGDLGWGEAARLDLGDISTARGPEHYIFLSMGIMRALGSTAYALSIVR